MQATSVDAPMPIPPSAVLEKVVSHAVLVQLKDGRRLHGKLMGIDEHLNLVLDDTEETGAEVRRKLGRIVLRGSSIIDLQSDVPAPRPA